jgi:lysozyme
MEKLNKKGLELIKYFEGLRLKPYLDVGGVATIGYGTIRYENGTPVTMKDKEITKERAEELLKHHVAEFEAGVNKLLKVDINDNQFAALVSFAYNLGLGNLKNSTLLRYINESRFKEAGPEFLKWINVNKKPVAGLKARRAKEKDLFETPQV